MTDRDLFIAALDHPDPADRAGWLEQACAGDPDRRRRVEVLLKAHDDASRFLAGPAAAPGDSVAPEDPTRTAHPSDETAPAAALDALSFLQPADKPGLLGKLDHYEVIEVVGKGGMGVVLKAFDPKLHRLVALKLMAPHLAAHGGARKRFEREAKAVAAVKNEHVVAIHGVETDSPAPYLVMEFVGGISLQDRLDRRGPADVKEILRIGMQSALGLAAAHKVGIIHRDIKPANILLENGVERVKITDFGLARAADDANLTQSGVITGTPNYMSPEQAAGTPVNARSDLFSLGSVLYALCTGHPPFRAETPLAVLRRVCDDPIRPPREVNPDVPDWLDAIVRKLLAKNPADRFQTADDVAELLGQHLAHVQQPATVAMPTPVVVAGTGERVWRQIFEATDRDQRLWQHGMILTGLVLVGLAAAVGIPSGSYLILFAPAVIGLALIAVGGFERQQWDVSYKGRTIRFQNSPFTGERLFVDGVRIATGGFGFMRELRGTIPDGPGAGDQVRALCEAGFLSFKCRISVTEGGPKPPVPAPVLPAALPTPASPRPQGAGLGCLLAPLALVALVLFRDTLYQFYRSVYFAPIDMGLSVWFGWTLIRAGRRRATSAANRRVWDLALIVLLAGTAVSLVVWRNDLVDHRQHPQWKDWHFGALLLTLLIGEMALVPWLLARRRERLAAAPPADEPPAPPTGPSGFAWLIALGIVAVPFLLYWTHESFWEGYFRPGITAPLYMIVSSGLLLAVLWWCRRQSEPAWYRQELGFAMAAIVGGTLMGLLMSWGEGTYLDKLGGASTWHNGGIFLAFTIVMVSVGIRVVRWVATDPRPWSQPPMPAASPPGFDLLTALVLAGGFAALGIGFVNSKIYGDPDLQVSAREQWQLLAGWAAFALACFGPFALLSRWYWRRRSPARAGRGGWVGVAGTVGILATLASAWFVINYSAAIRAEVFGPPVPTVANLGMNWNRDLVSRVTLERDGRIVEEYSGKVAGSAGHVEPGNYVVRGFKNDQEVYREEFSVAGGDARGVDLFDQPQDPTAPRVWFDCQDPTLTIEVIGPGHQFRLDPGPQRSVWQGLKPGAKYRVGIARGNDVIHIEDIQLGPGEERVFHIPRIVRADRRTELKPKGSPFPSDVTRMEISPDRSAIAVERFIGEIQVFDPDTGEERFTIHRPQSHGTAFGFSPDSKHLAFVVAATPSEQVLRIVDAVDGHAVEKDLKPGAGREFVNSHALAFSPDGNRLAVSSAYNAVPDNHWKSHVLRWELAPDGMGPRELEPLDGLNGRIEAVRFTGDGSEVLAVSGAEAAGWLWQSGHENRRLGPGNFTNDVLAAGKDHEAVAGWIASRNQADVGAFLPYALREPPPDSPPLSAVAFSCLAFSPDDKSLAAGTKGLPNLPWDQLAAVHIWDAKTGKERAILLGHADWPLAIAFDPDGKGVLTAGKDGTVRHWKLP
jgi:WD40 repeat protein/tRNA A-37 threonylcarbamoyl transferase component Bud32